MTLYVVGMGPGDHSLITPATRKALERSRHVVGYGYYLDLLGELIAGHQRHDFALGQETERVDCALDLAARGESAALVSSGDAGIYAMASLVFEQWHLRPELPRDLAIEVVPGISAMQAVAARIGAPLGHDFAVISLSDLMTPWPVIETRIEAASRADFVLVFYNPRSRKRRHQLETAAALCRRHRDPDTPVVIGRNISRADENVEVVQLQDLTRVSVDMLTLVIVGNSQTVHDGPWVYTPRGYADK